MYHRTRRALMIKMKGSPLRSYGCSKLVIRFGLYRKKFYELRLLLWIGYWSSVVWRTAKVARRWRAVGGTWETSNKAWFWDLTSGHAFPTGIHCMDSLYGSFIADPKRANRRLRRFARFGSVLTVLSTRPWACWSTISDDRESVCNEMQEKLSLTNVMQNCLKSCSVDW